MKSRHYALFLAIAIGILFQGCTEPKPAVWKGLPDTKRATCSPWDGLKSTCIVDGRAYLCVDRAGAGCRVDAQCAPVSLDKDPWSK